MGERFDGKKIEESNLMRILEKAYVRDKACGEIAAWRFKAWYGDDDNPDRLIVGEQIRRTLGITPRSLSVWAGPDYPWVMVGGRFKCTTYREVMLALSRFFNGDLWVDMKEAKKYLDPCGIDISTLVLARIVKRIKPGRFTLFSLTDMMKWNDEQSWKKIKGKYKKDQGAIPR